MESRSAPVAALPSLSVVRAGLESPARHRAPMWLLLLVALFAAVTGVSVAAVMIFGPGGEPTSTRHIRLNS